MVQDYTSSSIGKRTQKLSYSYTWKRWELYGDNIRSSSAGEYSTGIRYSVGNLTFGGDARMIVGERVINNSGVLLEYRGKLLKFNGELRPLLRYGTIRFSPSLDLAGHTVGLTSLYGRAHYRLPTYSEDLITYDFSPYVRGKFEHLLPVNYNLTVGYSGREYPLTPMKSYTLYRAVGDVSLNFSTAFVVHRFRAEGRLNRYNYVGLTAEGEIPVGVEERSKFEYVPTFMEIFKIVMSVNRTLNTYSGVLKDRSQVYRNILIEGNVETENTGVYLRRRREDHVFLHRSRSSNTRTLLRYVLGVFRTMGNFRFDWEVSAIYTLYRFRSAENSLYRYFDNAVSYRGRSEFFLRIRLWDRGRYVADSAIYYRLVKGMDLYSHGWVPIASVGDVDVGLSYDVKPDGRAVGVMSRFPGGEVTAMRRYENDHLFWQISMKFSKTF